MNKRVLVTGGSRGIGAAVVRLFATAGYEVAIGYHASPQAAGALANELSAKGATIHLLQGDVSRRTQAFSLVEQATAAMGGLDILICAAGVASSQLVTNLADEEWQRLLGVNLSGTLYCAQAALGPMVRQKSGSIITLSSIWGLQGASCEVAYSATKAGIIGLSKALAQEVGPSGIRVNCVAPGVIDTDMIATLTPEDRATLAENTPLGRIGTPEEAAAAILFLAGEQASFITGQVLSPNGGFMMG